MNQNISNLQQIPTRYRYADQRKIGIFQLKYSKRLFQDKTIGGIFDVMFFTDSDDDMPQQRANITEKWLTGAGAVVRFEADYDGRCWFPDDPFWHNRLVIMDTPLIYNTIEYLRTSDGLIKSAGEVRMEIDCLADVLKYKKKVYAVYINHVEKTFFADKADAEAWVADEKDRISKLPPQQALSSTRKYNIRETITLDYKDEIKEIVRKEGGKYQFGWTQSTYFLEKVRPAVMELIASKDVPVAAASVGINEEELIKVATDKMLKNLGLTKEDIEDAVARKKTFDKNYKK